MVEEFIKFVFSHYCCSEFISEPCKPEVLTTPHPSPLPWRGNDVSPIKWTKINLLLGRRWHAVPDEGFTEVEKFISFFYCRSEFISEPCKPVVLTNPHPSPLPWRGNTLNL